MTRSNRPITFKKTIDDIVIGGCSLTALAQAYGTPLYVLCDATIRAYCNEFKQAVRDYPSAIIAYASKANISIGLANILASEGIGADVVSGGELYTILNSNIQHDHIYFHGNNKSMAELELAIDHAVKIVVDNPYELQYIQTICQTKKVKANVMIRLKPGIEAHTHEHIKTGQDTSKFGISLNEAIHIIKAIATSEWLEFIGIHAHIGSQIIDAQPFYDLVNILSRFIHDLNQHHDISVHELNCGGGFGVQYLDSDASPNIPVILQTISKQLLTACHDIGISPPTIIFEPGRSIIATAGVTIYSVGAIKPIPNHHPYLFIDGGMADNPRPMLYQAQHSIDIVSPKTDLKETYTIAGKFCESGDILATNCLLPQAQIQDHIVVYGTGAYNYSMSSNYNRFCKPAMVLLSQGNATPLIRRETLDDVIRYDQ